MISAISSASMPAPKPAPTPSNAAMQDRFERKAFHLDTFAGIFQGVGEVVYDVLPWLGGIALGAAGAASGGVVGAIAGALIGSIPFKLLGWGLDSIGNALANKANDNHNLALMAGQKIPPMNDAAIPSDDGSKISLGISDYHGMGSNVNLHVQYFPKGAATPTVDFLTSRAYIDDQIGELHARGRGLDGQTYKVAAAFPQVGLESFDFSRPVAARLYSPEGVKDFSDPNPSPGLMTLPGP